MRRKGGIERGGEKDRRKLRREEKRTVSGKKYLKREREKECVRERESGREREIERVDDLVAERIRLSPLWSSLVVGSERPTV